MVDTKIYSAETIISQMGLPELHIFLRSWINFDIHYRRVQWEKAEKKQWQRPTLEKKFKNVNVWSKCTDFPGSNRGVE